VKRCAGESCKAAYWARGIREPVRFASAVGALRPRRRCWLELNAHPALAHSVRNVLWPAEPNPPPVISSAPASAEFESCSRLMDLHRAGFRSFFRNTPSGISSAAAYAWEKARWWNEASDAAMAPRTGGRGLFDVRLPRAMPTWIVRLDSRHWLSERSQG